MCAQCRQPRTICTDWKDLRTMTSAERADVAYICPGWEECSGRYEECTLSRCCSDGAAPAHRSPLPPGTSPTPSHMLFLLPLLPLCLSVSVSVSLALSVSPRPSRSLCASSATQPTHRARLPARESVCTAAANSPPRPLLHEWSISPSLSLPLSLTRVLSPSPSASHPQGIGHDRTEALH